LGVALEKGNVNRGVHVDLWAVSLYGKELASVLFMAQPCTGKVLRSPLANYAIHSSMRHVLERLTAIASQNCL
ncbi:MAG: hypothetical protein RR882_05865, partial [Comamonas sp.]